MNSLRFGALRTLLTLQSLKALSILVLSCVLALFAGEQAALAYWRGLAPSVVPRMFGSDAQLQVGANDYRFIENVGQMAPDAQRLSQTAREALAQSPFNVIAMRQLGMLADLRHPNEAGWSYFDNAEDITARDLPNQVALINQTVMQGDVTAILTHYDRALRVFPNSSDALFPPLIRASSEQGVRDELTRFAKSPWFTPFLGQLLNQSMAPEKLTDFILRVRPQMAVLEADKLGAVHLGQLLGKGLYGDARNWIHDSQPLLASVVDDLGFSPRTTDPRLASLAWSFASREGIDVTPTEAGTLEISIGAGRHETVAERTTILPAGNYDLIQTMTFDAAEPMARLSWKLHCLTGGSQTPVWQFEPAAHGGRQTFRSHFTIPQGCQAQAWKLSAHSDNTQFVSSGEIAKLVLSQRP